MFHSKAMRVALNGNPAYLFLCDAHAGLQQGNRHFQAQEYQQAAAAYSQALALGVDDTSLTAVLLCNRAASQHAAGQYLDAIADCCLAHQLDPKYPRALQVCMQSSTMAQSIVSRLQYVSACAI